MGIPSLSSRSSIKSLEMTEVWLGNTTSFASPSHGTNYSCCIYGGWKIRCSRNSRTFCYLLLKMRLKLLSIILEIHLSSNPLRSSTIISNDFGFWFYTLRYKDVRPCISGFNICKGREYSLFVNFLFWDTTCLVCMMNSKISSRLEK